MRWIHMFDGLIVLAAASICCANVLCCAPQDPGAESRAENQTEAGVDDEELAEAVEEAEARIPYSILTTDRLTGDWCGRRTCLEDGGVTVELSTTSYLQGVARGGLSTNGAWSLVGTVDYEITLDLGKMDLIPGGTIYAWSTTAWGKSPTLRGWTGDLFYVNGAEVGGDRLFDVHDLWYEQALFDDMLKIRVGRISLSYSFDVNAYAWDPYTQFLNYGLNNAPNIPFPANAFAPLAAQVTVAPCDWFSFSATIADADAEFNETGFRTAFGGPPDFFSMFECEFKPTFETKRGELPGHYRAGLWWEHRDQEEFFDSMGGAVEPPIQHDTVGAYLNFDQLVYREKPCEDGNEEGLGIFGRYSYAPGDVSLIEHFWSIGAQYRGLLACRSDDVLGLGVGQGLLSSRSRDAGYDPGRETVIEAYYRIQVLPWVTVSPDVQWILSPGGEGGRDAWILGLRVGITF